MGSSPPKICRRTSPPGASHSNEENTGHIGSLQSLGSAARFLDRGLNELPCPFGAPYAEDLELRAVDFVIGSEKVLVLAHQLVVQISGTFQVAVIMGFFRHGDQSVVA